MRCLNILILAPFTEEQEGGNSCFLLKFQANRQFKKRSCIIFFKMFIKRTKFKKKKKLRLHLKTNLFKIYCCKISHEIALNQRRRLSPQLLHLPMIHNVLEFTNKLQGAIPKVRKQTKRWRIKLNEASILIIFRKTLIQ